MLLLGLALPLLTTHPARAQEECVVTERISQTAGGIVGGGNQNRVSSGLPLVSMDGRYVLFRSNALDLLEEPLPVPLWKYPPPVFGSPRFMHDRATGKTVLLSRPIEDGWYINFRLWNQIPEISGDARYVYFEQYVDSGLLFPTEGESLRLDITIHVYDRITGKFEAPVKGPQGEPLVLTFLKQPKGISADGRIILFFRGAQINGHHDHFWVDRQTGEMVRFNETPTGERANGIFGQCAISGDGRIIAVHSAFATDLMAEPPPTGNAIYIYDREARRYIEQIPLFPVPPSSTLGHPFKDIRLSGDGRFVAYVDTLPPTGEQLYGHRDIFVFDRLLGTTTDIGPSIVPDEARRLLWRPSISEDGRYVAFSVWMPNPPPADPETLHKRAVVYDRTTGQHAVLPGALARSLVITGNGRELVFTSGDRLTEDDLNDNTDVFVANNCLYTEAPCSLNVIIPNGGWPWAPLYPVSIMWTGAPDGGSDTVRIELWRDGAFVQTIAANTPNDGNFDWTVPADLPLGDGYRVRVADPVTPSACFDESNASFAVEEPTCGLLIRSPAEGSAWASGQTHTVQWAGLGPNLGDVRIELFRGFGTFVATLAEAVPVVDREAEVFIPADLPSRDDYYIVVTEVIDETCSARVPGHMTIDAAPTVTLTATPTTALFGTPIEYTATASDPEGLPLNYTWFPEDPGVGIAGGSTLLHTHAATGVFQSRVVVRDAAGLEAEATVEVVIAPELSVTAFPRFAQVGSPIVFRTPHPPGFTEFDAYTWDFGDGTPLVLGPSVLAHAYTAPGAYIVTLTATDRNGAPGTAAITVIIGAPDVATFQVTSSPATPLAGDLVTFDVTQTGGGVKPFGAYAWDFGDGTVGETVVPTTTHTYAAAGAYAGRVVGLTTGITAAEADFYVTVGSDAVLVWESAGVPEEVCGDFDGVVEPGEHFRVPVTLRNTGAATATGVVGSVEVPRGLEDFHLMSPGVQFPNIPGGGIGTAFVEFILAPEAAQCGTPVQVDLTGIFWDGGAGAGQSAVANFVIGGDAFICDFVGECNFWVPFTRELRLLEPGSTWTYDATEGPVGPLALITHSVPAGTVNVNGVETGVVQGTDGYQYFYTNDALGLQMHRRVDPSQGGRTETFSPPVNLSAARHATGWVVPSAGAVTLAAPGGTVLGVFPYTASASIEAALVPLTVPAGEFETVRARWTLTAMNPGACAGSWTETNTVWVDLEASFARWERTREDPCAPDVSHRTLELVASNRLPCADDIFEPDNTSGLATPVTDGETQTHTICPGDETDWYSFAVTAPSDVVVETSGPAGDTILTLYDGTVTEIETDDDGGAGFFSRVDRQCGVDPLPVGTYFVRIMESGQNENIDSYDISLTVTPCALVPATGVTAAPSPLSPQLDGTAVTWTAAGEGGIGLYEYQFWRNGPDTSGYVVEQAYGGGDTWVWDTTGHAGDHTIAATVRTAGTTTTYDAFVLLAYTVTAPGPPPPASGVTAEADPPASQEEGLTATFTAAGQGGNGTYEYQFWRNGPDTSGYVVEQTYGGGATWVWDTTGHVGDHTIAATVRTAGTTTTYDAFVLLDYTVTAPGPPPPATGVTAEADPPASQEEGLTATFTAAGQGGNGTYEYQFWRNGPDTSGYVVEQAFGGGDTWNWDTTGHVGDHTIAATVRTAGTTSTYDAFVLLAYTVTPAAPLPPATGATLGAAPASPQPQGTIVTFTGGGVGGTGNYEFAFWRNATDTGGNWALQQNYSTDPTWDWNTTGLAGAHTIAVTVRTAGTSVNMDAFALAAYTVQP